MSIAYCINVVLTRDRLVTVDRTVAIVAPLSRARCCRRFPYSVRERGAANNG